MSVEVISLLALIVSLAFLIILSYRGWPLGFVALVCAIFIFIAERMLVPDLPSITTLMKTTFMTGFGNFSRGYFLLLLFSTAFALLMGDSGAADAIAQATVKVAMRFPGKERYMVCFSLIVISAILSAGGISTFVIIFVIIPIAKSLFQEMDVPWHLAMTFVLGVATFTLGGLPGMPSINNIIPTPYLGTTPMAGFVLGIIGSLLLIVLGSFYIIIVVRKSIRDGEGFEPTGTEFSKTVFKKNEYAQKVTLWQALIPVATVLVVLNVFRQPAEVAMIAGCLMCYLMFRKNLPDVIRSTIAAAVPQTATVVVTTSVIVGYGAAASSTIGYQMVVNGLIDWNIPTVWKIIISVNILCGLLGSSSGGLAVTFEQLGGEFLASGLNPQVIHRVAAFSSIGMDSLPHCSAVVMALATYKLTHRQAYKHVFFLQTLFPLLAGIFMGFLAMAGVV